MVAGIGKLRRGRRPYFQAEHGRKYGQDRRCRYFSNDFNATVRIRYPQRGYFGLSCHTHCLPSRLTRKAPTDLAARAVLSRCHRAIGSPEQ